MKRFSSRFFRKSTHFAQPKLRGVSLVEAILALGLAGIAITQGIEGLNKYTTGLKVQSTASKLTHLNRAADRFAEDNFTNLMASAPEELDISALAPYLGDNIGPDAFGNQYKLTTRTYGITVPDPVNGGTKTERGLQVLVLAEAPSDVTILSDEPQLRVEVASSADAAAGFISDDYRSCLDNSGTLRPSGHICGAFGGYSFNPGQFAGTDFSDVALVSLVTKGDSSVYGDQLYRYDYGDPELNTMHTDIYMGLNNIVDPDEITGVDRISFNANDSILESDDGARLAVRSGEDLRIQARNGKINFNASNNEYEFRHNPNPNPADCWGLPCTNHAIRLSSTSNAMKFDNAETIFGNKQFHAHDSIGLRTGTGNIWAGIARINNVQANSVNSLFQTYTSALRLQSNRDNGEVIVGKRVRYQPDGDPRAGIYEISDGQITAQHIQVQDITCADCGGSLSRILPKWRHMGTYFIPDGEVRLVPKPACYPNRTSVKNRTAHGDDMAYQETTRNDERYEPKIILVPRQFAFKDTKHARQINFRFDASDLGPAWATQANVTAGLASALAKTYCVFVGGDADPTTGGSTVLPTTDTANWQRIE